MRTPDWAYYRSFLAVASHRNLSVAAVDLELSQPTVSRHIAALEAAVGTTLFVRGKQSLRMTDAARSLLPHARAMAESSESALRSLSGQPKEPTGSVRLTAPPIVGSDVLPPILTAFRSAHPRIVIELVVSPKTEDLLAGEADIAVRMRRPTQEALIAKRIGTVTFGAFAHKDYLARFGEPPTFAHLAEHTIIGPDRDMSDARARGIPYMNIKMFALRTDDEHTQNVALQSGFGIGLMQLALATTQPSLKRILPSITYSCDMWLSMHEDLKSTKRVWLLFQHLASHLTAFYSAKGTQKTPRGRNK